jgi:uncharacterized protein
MTSAELVHWTDLFEAKAAQVKAADSAHDISHVRRVVQNATYIAARESSRLEIVLPAAWLHELDSPPKGSSTSKGSSSRAAAEASKFLQSIEYPKGLIGDIAHAIEAHSFSANIRPLTGEAKVVQDADRLDALGAIGIVRVFATSCAMPGQVLYCEEDPFSERREPDDHKFALDHFRTKLFKLVDLMNTVTAREEGIRRTAFMDVFVYQLKMELSLPK